MATMTWDEGGGVAAAPDVSSRAPISVRRLIAFVMVSAGVAIVVSASTIRAFEATAASVVVGLLTQSETMVVPSTASFFWGMGTDKAHGLYISPECSLAYIAGPMFVGFGLLLLLQRLPTAQVVIGAVVGVALMLAINTVRISLVAMSLFIWETHTAFWWAHVVLGSMIAVIGNVVSVALALRIAFRNQAFTFRRRPEGS